MPGRKTILGFPPKADQVSGVRRADRKSDILYETALKASGVRIKRLNSLTPET
ncbi:hypothetical protein D1BOALGB6SA_1236 [Olavius sp. associated proteobacterium Delta 1]|nr:hypothetical protein D1BOALGB6SA_1236 [Olavius sp. associated proteobacterium Delta 1]